MTYRCRRCGYTSDDENHFAWARGAHADYETYEPDIGEPFYLLSCKHCWIDDVDLADALIQQVVWHEDMERPVGYGMWPLVQSDTTGRLFHN